MIRGNLNVDTSLSAAYNNDAESIAANIDADYVLSGNINSEVILVGEVAIPKTLKQTTYKGDYEVTPDVYGRVLYTSDKYLEDDVTVLPIPYYETSNDSGTTVIIG